MRLLLPGASTDFVSTPDSAGLSVTGDIDLRVMVALDDWFDAAVAAQVLISKWGAGGFSYSVHVNNAGTVVLQWTSDNMNVDTLQADQRLPVADGDEPLWVRVTLDVDNGASGHTARFYTSYNGTDWSELGDAAVGAGTTSIYDGNTDLVVGARSDGFACEGSVYKAQVYDGIDGTQRASLDFTDVGQGWVVGDDAGDTGTDDQSNVWTIAGAASVAAAPSNIQGVQVFLAAALGSNPITAEPIWTDLTDDLRGVEFERGRQYELDRIEAGTMTVLLGNNHGNYNAHNTQGAYHPNIKPTVPIRLHALYDGTVYPLWSGFVERWPVSFPGKTDSVVEVQCVDLFKLLSLAQAAAADRESAVDALSPVAHWRFGDTSDRTGNGHTLTFSGSPTPGDATGAWQGDEATTFDGSDDFATVATPDDVIRAGSARTWEFWLYVDSTGSGTPFAMDITGAGSARLARLNYSHSNNTFIVESAAFFADTDRWNHVVFAQDPTGGTQSVWLNGVLVFDEISYNEPSGPYTLRIGSTAAEGFHWDGRISEIVVYPTALTDAQVQNLFDATTEAYIDQLTSERVAYFLDNFTFPTSPPQNLETGQTTIDGPNSPTDGSVLAGIQVAAETENGVFFIAANGDATFHDRDYRSTDQASSTATFGPADLGIWNIDLAFDDERIYNEIKIAPDDNTDPFISRDQDSIDAHGRRTFERTIYPADANEALDAANWLRAVYAEAATRIGTMSLRPGTDTALWPVVLAAEIGNRYTINKTATGDDYSDDHYLESISMKITREKTWEVDWQLSPANDFTVWILGDDNLSILGDTTVLGY